MEIILIGIITYVLIWGFSQIKEEK